MNYPHSDHYFIFFSLSDCKCGYVFQAAPCTCCVSVWVLLDHLSLRLVFKLLIPLMLLFVCVSWPVWEAMCWKFLVMVTLWSVFTQLVFLNLLPPLTIHGLAIQRRLSSLTFHMTVRSSHLAVVMEETLFWERSVLLSGLQAPLLVMKDGLQNICWYVNFLWGSRQSASHRREYNFMKL